MGSSVKEWVVIVQGDNDNSWICEEGWYVEAGPFFLAAPAKNEFVARATMHPRTLETVVRRLKVLFSKYNIRDHTRFFIMNTNTKEKIPWVGL